MKPASATASFKFRVVKRGIDFGTTIIAIYHKNAKDGEAPLWIGQRKDKHEFLNSVKQGKAMVEIIVHTSNGSEIIPVDMSYVADSNIDSAVMCVVNRHFSQDEVLSARWYFVQRGKL